MNGRFAAIAGLAGLLGSSACVDLDEAIVSDVTASYYETAPGLEDAVDAAYSGLQDLYGEERTMTMLEQGTDMWNKGYGGSHQQWNDYDSRLEPNTAYARDQWNQTYRSINTTNAVLNRAANIKSGIPESRKNQRIAEARFLRALYYFYLTRHYGDLYLTLEETQGVVIEGKRTPRAEIYSKVIIPDLEAAVATLPPTQADHGRATKGAAQHLLALVYLTRAEPGDMARAEQLGKAVIASGQYELLPRYGDIFRLENERNREVILSVQYTNDPLTTGKGNRWHLYWLMEYDREIGMRRTVEYGRPFVRLRPSVYLNYLHDRSRDVRYEQSFEHVWYVNAPNPARGLALGDTAIFMPAVKTSQLPAVYHGKKYTIFTEPDDYDRPRAVPLGTGVPNVKAEYDYRYYPSMNKYIDPTRTSVNEERGQRDLIVYRLADTYLMVAEALVRQGKAAEAVPFVNAVRQRAAKPGQATAMAVTASQLTYPDFILDERARELFGEGHRWFDLVRTGTLVERVRKYNTDARPNIKDHHVLRPIPQTEIDRVRNSDGTPFGQNPGY